MKTYSANYVISIEYLVIYFSLFELIPFLFHSSTSVHRAGRLELDLNEVFILALLYKLSNAIGCYTPDSLAVAKCGVLCMGFPRGRTHKSVS